MSEAKPCIMTLDPVAGIITDREDIAAYIIRQMFGNPGNTSDVYGDILVSFNELSSRYNDNLAELSNAIQNKLENIIRTYFPTDSISVQCSIVNEKDRNYNLSIRTLIKDNFGTNQPLLTDAKVKVQDGGFTINFKGA